MIYIGYTTDLETRLEFHKNAAAPIFTSKANDWNVYLKINSPNKSQAL
ncbi:GIY-YIG nuclease family protein [Flavobacterium sp.]